MTTGLTILLQGWDINMDPPPLTCSGLTLTSFTLKGQYKGVGGQEMTTGLTILLQGWDINMDPPLPVLA